MNISFSKIDPTCYNILPIDWEECPEASLSTIGVNFSALDAEICNLTFSANNYWNPLYTAVSDNSGDWDAVFNLVSENSACWQSTYLTVMETSGAWLTPISIVYPEVIQKDTYNTGTILEWVKSNFPISQGGCINYLNGQILKVFTLKYAISYQSITCNCTSNGGTIAVAFIGIGARYVSCGCSCTPGRVNASDRYVDTVEGMEVVVENGEWVFLREIY